MGFVDKLKQQASSLGSQIDQALDSTKQKGQIGSLRKQRGEMVSQLGEALLEQFRQQQLDVEQLRPQADQIFNLEWQIIEAEKVIEAQKQAAAAATPPPQAPAAAQAPPAPPAAAAPAPPQPAQTGTVTCPSCGGEVPTDSAFCPNCGAKV
ncbi:MAG: zinc ribbon domain-containing protein [Actinomycetota bacterium]|nr:zinc ribbon domain-containing protein [Actinomycetota bacterium]MDD5666298.1 zinc ribbon domain-containing protein [Actinomycetota bacterium]